MELDNIVRRQKKHDKTLFPMEIKKLHHYKQSLLLKTSRQTIVTEGLCYLLDSNSLSKKEVYTSYPPGCKII